MKAFHSRRPSSRSAHHFKFSIESSTLYHHHRIISAVQFDQLIQSSSESKSAMAELQRSESTFRRQGSSGLIWDDKFLQRALNQVEAEKQAEAAAANAEAGGAAPSDAGAADVAGGGRGYKPVKVAPPMMDPPSPKVSGCCGVFGKPAASKKRARSNNKRRSK